MKPCPGDCSSFGFGHPKTEQGVEFENQSFWLLGAVGLGLVVAVVVVVVAVVVVVGRGSSR